MAVALALSASFGVASVSAARPLPSGSPSGEVTFGQTVIEPAYDLANGNLVYLSTPKHAVVHPNFAKNVAPIYLPMYPAGVNVGTLNCEDVPVENCPDHGPEVAGLAQAMNPTVYGAGVQGHDHLVGIASTGGDFNVLWLPVVVLFNTPEAVTHITTMDQLHALETAKAVTEIPLESVTFHCSGVSAAVYANGTPFQLP
jgi:hypothetical protein